MSVTSKLNRDIKKRNKAKKQSQLRGAIDIAKRHGKQDALSSKPDKTTFSTRTGKYRPEWELSKVEKAYRKSYQSQSGHA